MATIGTVAPSLRAAPEARLRVGLAVPSAAIRAALRLWLEATPGTALIFCTDSWIESHDAHGIDVVVAELPVPTPSLHHAVASFLDVRAEGRVTILTFYAEAWKALIASPRVQTLDLASIESDGLAVAVLGYGVISAPCRRQGRPAPRLEDRDQTILRLVARGCKNGDIAGYLGVSSRTVQYRVSGLMNTMGVSSRAALMARVNTPMFSARSGETERWPKR